MSEIGVSFPLFTSRYAEKRIADTDLVPVGITVGHPRFRLSYPLAGKLKALAPERSWFDLPSEDFGRRYLLKLEHQGALAIATALTEIFDAHATAHSSGLALLCFEDLAVPDTFCHRRMFAGYWEAQTGQRVDELAFPENVA